MKYKPNPEQLLMLCNGETVEIDGKKIHITEVTADVIPEPKPTIQPVWERYPTWDSLGGVEGFYISSLALIHKQEYIRDQHDTVNTFRTEAQCKFALAAAQLSQLVHKWNEECGEEWGHDVYCILAKRNDKTFTTRYYASPIYVRIDISFLTFKTQQLAEKFIELNTPLLKDFFMLND